MSSLMRRIMVLYRRAVSTVLLMILIILIIVKGHNFQVSRIYQKSLKFIETAVKGRKLSH